MGSRYDRFAHRVAMATATARDFARDATPVVKKAVEELIKAATESKSLQEFVVGLTSDVTGLGRRKWRGVLKIEPKGAEPDTLDKKSKRTIRILKAEDKEALQQVQSDSPKVTVYRLIPWGEKERPLEVGESNMYLSKKVAEFMKDWDDEAVGRKHKILTSSVDKSELILVGGCEVAYTPKEFRDVAQSYVTLYSEAWGLRQNEFTDKIPPEYSWLVDIAKESTSEDDFHQRLNLAAKPVRPIREARPGEFVVINSPKEYGVNYGEIKEVGNSRVIVETGKSRKRLIALPYSCKVSPMDMRFFADKPQHYFDLMYRKVRTGDDIIARR